ncbi:MAG: RdgB/HAM1 family non-canonical purine NTP pyrophosphatase [Deltaproteobacteria bacterium]|nr:RdgB/HAM1 family non-canonical purine NTP pyrophosphatase [Deltaproteobacteria bacterium]
MKVVIATNNRHKIVEIGASFAPHGIVIAPLPRMTFPPETGLTFAENASIKAVAASQSTGYVSIGDDSGLCVDALGGQPGINSARYAGSPTDDNANNIKLLQEMHGTTRDDRSAQFVCALAVAQPDGALEVVEGRVNGIILMSSRGVAGFGYDPLFFLPSVGKTMAELSPIEKDAISHRGRAVRLVIPILLRLAKAKRTGSTKK